MLQFINGVTGKLAHRGMQLHKGLGAQEGTRAVGGLAADDITDRQRTTSSMVGCVVAGAAGGGGDVPADDVDGREGARAHAQMRERAEVPAIGVGGGGRGGGGGEEGSDGCEG